MDSLICCGEKPQKYQTLQSQAACRILPSTPSSNKQEPSGTSREAANIIHDNIKWVEGNRVLNHLHGLRQSPKNQEMRSTYWAVGKEAFHLCNG